MKAGTASDTASRHGAIVNLCPTGMVPDKAMTPHVPVTPGEIVADARACIEAGANLVHLHARGDDGQPHYSREIYARQIAGIRESHVHDVTIVKEAPNYRVE